MSKGIKLNGVRIEMGETIEASLTVKVQAINCYCCSVPIWLDPDFVDNRRRDHASFYCPNGHSNHFPGKSNEEALKEQLAAAQKQRDALRQDYEVERQARVSVQRKLCNDQGQSDQDAKPNQKRCVSVLHEILREPAPPHAVEASGLSERGRARHSVRSKGFLHREDTNG